MNIGVVAFHVEHIVWLLSATYCVVPVIAFQDNHSKLCHVHINDYDDVVDDTISSLKRFGHGHLCEYI